jgi:hypothetical protein
MPALDPQPVIGGRILRWCTTRHSVVVGCDSWLRGAYEAPRVHHWSRRRLAWPAVVQAQQPERLRRIGVLQPGSESDPESQLRRAAFVDGLIKFGWTEATNVSVHYRWVDEDVDRIRLYATELTSMQPDVIWASGSLPLLLLRRATRTIPIVFTQVYDPVGSGFVTNLTRPDGNITGFTLGEFYGWEDTEGA